MSEIVIAGIAGRFPESDDLEEFWDHLVAGIDMVTDDDRRWNRAAFPGIPSRSGKLKSLDRFDNEFFGISKEEADAMEPGLRKHMSRINVFQSSIYVSFLSTIVELWTFVRGLLV